MNEAPASHPAPAAVGSHGVDPGAAKHGSDVAKLALGALGVVYGDIGTSPLYALKECVTLPHGVEASTANIYGLLSLVFWAITLVISVKYILYVMRADNNGEGGVLALMALAARVGQSKTHADEKKPRRSNWHDVKRSRYFLITLGLFGSALLYGDGVITPAISVLSAVEGLNVISDTFRPFVLPVSIGVILLLFFFQSGGEYSLFVMALRLSELSAITARIFTNALIIYKFISNLKLLRFFVRKRLYYFIIRRHSALCKNNSAMFVNCIYSSFDKWPTIATVQFSHLLFVINK